MKEQIKNNSGLSRVVSGMRSTGDLHLGHYHGVLKNWVQLQSDYECFYFVADWHALTTHYENTENIQQSSFNMAVDWLACGIDPKKSHVFVQSSVPEHAELHLLLSMITPIGWLERVPTYKDQQEKLKELDLATYGFLGYPLLQTADVAVYKGQYVPVGEDQVAHLELSREVARRFNFLFGREKDFDKNVLEAQKKLGKKLAKQFAQWKTAFQEQGNKPAHDAALAMIHAHPNLSSVEKERLQGDLEGTGKTILVEPNVLLSKASKMPGLDGQKMSKSYHNVISLRDDADTVTHKIKTMPTDPARVRRNDPGDPERCPVWQWHQLYSQDDRKQWVQEGCKTAGIGCLECKQPLIDAVNAELSPIQKEAVRIADDRSYVQQILKNGAQAARQEAQKTLKEVREAMGFQSTDI